MSASGPRVSAYRYDTRDSQTKKSLVYDPAGAFIGVVQPRNGGSSYIAWVKQDDSIGSGAMATGPTRDKAVAKAERDGTPVAFRQRALFDPRPCQTIAAVIYWTAEDAKHAEAFEQQIRESGVIVAHEGIPGVEEYGGWEGVNLPGRWHENKWIHVCDYVIVVQLQGGEASKRARALFDRVHKMASDKHSRLHVSFRRELPDGGM